MLRVLVVDDTIVYRKIVSDVLQEIPGVQVVGTANNGKIALSRIRSLKPDLITLDIEMPEMNGLQVLEELRRESLATDVVMLSTLTVEGGAMTIQALELGAFDFIPKPQSGTMADNLAGVRQALAPIIRTLLRKKETQKRIRERLSGAAARPDLTALRPKPPEASPPAPRPVSRPPVRQNAEIVAIGISTGGPNALARMMPMLPPDLGVPIVIVQHMPPLFTQSLARSLDAKCSLTVREARHGDILEPNVALIAPGGKQMRIAAHADGRRRMIQITDDPPMNSCKPSADYLFLSVASHYVGRATGVIMTGMGSDGTKGLMRMYENGAGIIAQNEESCTVFGMPKEPIESGIATSVVHLDRIAEEIVKTVRGRFFKG
ncbi:protein-glutamate methylesterase/protein-glutamine glutaminase [Desulfatiferula olefinivorans]